MDTKLLLKEAIETGEILKIRYHGGSQPGSSREIAPISVQDSKVRARCYTSNAVKTFVISNIQIIDTADETDKWQKDKRPSLNYENLSQFLNKQLELFEKLGWHVEFHTSGDEQHLSLHSRFKNGNIRKSADVSLTYQKYSYEFVIDWESDSEQLEPTRELTGERQRPWLVSAKSETSRTYGSLDKAAISFLSSAQKLAPSN